MENFLEIDGSRGEGGGQVLRTALSLSAATGTEVALEKIRAGREKPGLMRQHLTCVRAVARICGAEVSGDEVGSGELSFAPGRIKAGDYRFDVGTAGSVTLVAQTVIPVLLKADAPSTVTITGGTHVPFSPIWEFFEQCYLPELRRMGARVEARLDSYGFYPAAGGAVTLRVWPFVRDGRTDRYELTTLGAYRGGSVVGVVSAIPASIAAAEVGIVAEQFPGLKLATEVRTVASLCPGNYCYARLDYERAAVVLSSVGLPTKSRRDVGGEVASAVQAFREAGRACERHLADQLLVPLAVCLGGAGVLDVQQKTGHYLTNADVIRMFSSREKQKNKSGKGR